MVGCRLKRSKGFIQTIIKKNSVCMKNIMDDQWLYTDGGTVLLMKNSIYERNQSGCEKTVYIFGFNDNYHVF